MEENLQNELEELKRENEALRSKMDKANTKEKRKKERKKSTLTWTWKLFTGASLSNSFNKWFSEYHSKETVSPDTSAGLLTALVKRFVRVRLLSLILLLFSILPSLVTLYILVKQNQLIETQNALVEGSRKSSYSFQIAGLFDAIDSKGISGQNIIPRIAALSHSLTPYRILEENGKLSERMYSPERTQLLLFLIQAKISPANLDKIYARADFSNCNFKNTNLSGAYLAGINLSNSSFENAELHRANLNEANLTKSNFEKAQFSNGKAINAIFSGSNLTSAKITNTNLSGSDFIGTKTSNTNFDRSTLKDTKGL